MAFWCVRRFARSKGAYKFDIVPMGRQGRSGGVRTVSSRSWTGRN